MESEVRLKFHGIRSLHACPSKANVLYGGNTNCIVIEDDSDLFVFNAGFGVSIFGDQLMAVRQPARKPVNCNVLFTDFTWDNIMGLPFFLPIHFKSTSIEIFSALDPQSASTWFAAACSRDFSPFSGVDFFNSKIDFAKAPKNRRIGSWTLTCIASPHPFAPYPSSTWSLVHQSGFKIVVCGCTPLASKDLASLSKKIGQANIVIVQAIAPSISHPTMQGRMTFSEAIEFGRQTGAQHVYITGIHPMLSDRDLIKAELDLSKQHKLQAGVQFSIAREWATIALPVHSVHQRAG